MYILEHSIHIEILLVINVGQYTSRSAVLDHERDRERSRIEQRFNEKNRQIVQLTSLVRTLTEKVSSNNREENDRDVLKSESSSHSDKRCCRKAILTLRPI